MFIVLIVKMFQDDIISGKAGRIVNVHGRDYNFDTFYTVTFLHIRNESKKSL